MDDDKDVDDADLDDGLEVDDGRRIGEDFVDENEGGAGRCVDGSSTTTTMSFELSSGNCGVDGRSTCIAKLSCFRSVGLSVLVVVVVVVSTEIPCWVSSIGRSFNLIFFFGLLDESVTLAVAVVVVVAVKVAFW